MAIVRPLHPRPGGALLLVAVAALAASVAAVPVLAEPAIGQFELKDLEAEPGEVEFQSQNAIAWGQRRRRFAETSPGEFVYDDNDATRQRHALEIEMSLTRYLRTRIGAEFEKERYDEPPSPARASAFDELKLTEVALEGVLVLKPVAEGGLGFGLLVEYEHPVEPGEMNSIVFGPILGARSGPWSALLNLTLVHHFGAGQRDDDGLERDDKWDLAYAMQLKYQADSAWALALEAYGTFDRIGDTGMKSEAADAFGDHDQHRAGPVVYYAWKRGGQEVASLDDDDRQAGQKDGEVTVTLGTGLLFGLTEDTPATTLKASLEIEF